MIDEKQETLNRSDAYVERAIDTVVNVLTELNTNERNEVFGRLVNYRDHWFTPTVKEFVKNA